MAIFFDVSDRDSISDWVNVIVLSKSMFRMILWLILYIINYSISKYFCIWIKIVIATHYFDSQLDRLSDTTRIFYVNYNWVFDLSHDEYAHFCIFVVTKKMNIHPLSSNFHLHIHISSAWQHSLMEIWYSKS